MKKRPDKILRNPGKPSTSFDGVYTVLDTGPEIQGRRVDLYMWSCNEALQFGRQNVRLTVLRMGWNPRATTRSFMDRLFRPEPRDEPDPEPVPQPSSPAADGTR